MKYFSVSVDIENRPILVVGGGEVAERRVEALHQCGAKITVVSPKVSTFISNLAAAGEIVLKKRPFHCGDTKDMTLVFTATDEPAINETVWEDAKASRVLVNIADETAHCDFIIPAIVRRGDLTVAISTGGKSPALASRLRQKFSDMLGNEYALLLETLSKWRPRLEARIKDTKLRKKLHYLIVDSCLMSVRDSGDAKDLERRLEDVVEEALKEEL